jgi:predicted HTH domain antitoxin
MSITIEIPPSIENILNKRALEQHLDRESILKQMLWESAEHYLVEEYSKGRISKGKLGEMLDMDIYEVNDLLDRYHIKGNLDLETFQEGIKTAESLAKYDSEKTRDNNE